MGSEGGVRQQTILLGVTGSIAAYKAVELVRLLQKRGFTVKAALTPAAAEFVTPLTFRTITGHPVASSMFEEKVEWKAEHVALADEASCIVVAPATADFIAKLAYGIADDILAATILASRAPIVIAPAMHAGMWENEATRRNVTALTERGFVFVGPEDGELASGDSGPGRLAALEAIAEEAVLAAATSRELAGKHVLVTAGGTREPIDAVRFIGNRASGKTGHAIAAEVARRGAKVTLVSAAMLPSPPGVELVRVETAGDMAKAVFDRFDETDAVVMTAAVADFAPAAPLGGKLKKSEAPASIELAANPDILSELGRRKGRQVLIGFAAETDDLLENARAKLSAKNLDVVVANDVSRPGIGFDSDDNEVVVVSHDGEEALPKMSKKRLAAAIVDRLVAELAVGGA
ncbi:MAG: bifunctional phosphopantothenoylcysteine decarboxylase/phosphopantothenate--cysteine ligase CoaBC [Actinobacteria bacterium]|nr:MAG: bifunctional phosphopantothenoylcysteine decarboxylase/phosphopantothenate--cysteine ligase CoaBC [Actinomycetota bacterium]